MIKKTTIKLLKCCLLVMLSFIQDGYSQSVLSRLDLNTVLTRSINKGQTHSYELELEKGQFALINVKQIGIDLIISTYNGEGNKIEKFDSRNGSNGNELVLIDAKEKGKYTLEIETLGEIKREKKGCYEIELQGLNKNIKRHLDLTLQTLAKRNFIPGFAVSLVNDKEIIYSNEFGYSNVKEKIPYTNKTRQCIASISKTFIGISIMILVEQGKLDINTDINNYLPFKVRNPYFPDQKITIKHLATHTASIYDGKMYDKTAIIVEKELYENTKYHRPIHKALKKISRNRDMPFDDFVTNFFKKGGTIYKKKNFLKVRPGEEWYYSNMGAALAAYIVSKVSNQPYNSFVEDHILTPLGLDETTWGINLSERLNYSLNYDINRNQLPIVKTITYPDGGIYTNSENLSEYLIHFINGFLRGNQILSKKSYNEIMKAHSKQQSGKFKGRRDGLFWEFGYGNKMGHSGGDIGISSRMYFYPKNNLGYTLIENIMPAASDDALTQSTKIKKVLERYISIFNIL